MSKELLEAVESGADHKEIYRLLRNAVANDLESATEDADRRDYYKIFLALQKEIDKKDLPDGQDEDAAELDKIAEQAQLWNSAD